MLSCPCRHAGLYPAAWLLPLEADTAAEAQAAQWAAQQPPGGLGEVAVGMRLLHFWELEDCWYPGTVVACGRG